MGMYDDVIVKTGLVCNCGSKQYYFQTKQLHSLLDAYIEGEDVSKKLNTLMKPLVVFEIHGHCDVCGKWFEGTGKIENGIFIGVKEYIVLE